MEATNKQILDELKQLRTDVNMLKERLIDPDTILTPEEEETVNEAIEDYKRGKTTSLEDLEKELEQEQNA